MNAKIIVITGITRGLGRAMSEEFIRLGYTVAGCGRSGEIIAELGRRYPPPHRFEAVDVADDVQVAAWAKNCLEALGPPDLLLNNAAVVNRNAPLWTFDAAEFDRVIDVNIKGAVNVIRHFLPAMLARRAGIVVNFSSGWGRSTAPEVAPYCASKWAMEGLSKSLAQELPPGMAAIPVSPGIIDTDMLRTSFGAAAAHYPGPEEWARRAVPWLLRRKPSDNGRSLSVGEAD